MLCSKCEPVNRRKRSSLCRVRADNCEGERVARAQWPPSSLSLAPEAGSRPRLSCESLAQS